MVLDRMEEIRKEIEESRVSRLGYSKAGTHPPTITRSSRNAPSTFATSIKTALLAVIWSNSAMPLLFMFRRGLQVPV